MSSSSFLVASLVSSLYNIMSPPNSDCFTSFAFWVSFTSFLLSFPWVGLPTEHSKVCWIRVDILVLVLKSEGMLSVFTIEYVSYIFVIYGFNYVEVCSLYLPFLERFFFFIINGWILSEVFSVSIEMLFSHSAMSDSLQPHGLYHASPSRCSCVFYSSICMWYNSATDLQILKTPCILEINPTWSECMTFLIYVGFRLLVFW